MTILVLGARGQIGSELMARAGTRSITGLGHAQLDIGRADAVSEVIGKLNPRLIINAAAYTAVDKAESQAELAYAVNRDGPAHLAQACATESIPLFHLSTDYVFDGRKPTAYVEDDEPSPTSIYGASKLAGEQAVRERLPQHLILRVSWVFGAYGNNFVRTMLKLAQSRPELRIVADQRGAPSHAGAIAEQLLKLADRYLAGEALPWGTYHYSGAPATNWHEFAQVIFAEAVALGLLEKLPAVQAISTADYPTPAKRPANSLLSAASAHERLSLDPHAWRDGLRETLRAWKQSA